MLLTFPWKNRKGNTFSGKIFGLLLIKIGCKGGSEFNMCFMDQKRKEMISYVGSHLKVS